MHLSEYESRKKPKAENHRVFVFLFLMYNLDNEPTANIQLQAKNKKLL